MVGLPKVTVYLPEELAEWVKSTPVNLSSIVQQAIGRERILRAQADLAAADEAAGVDEGEVQKWQVRLRGMKSSSTARS